MFKYFAFFLFFFGCFFAQAQQEVSLPMMLDIPNSVRFNPAWTTGYKWTVSLPSISQNFSSNGPSVDQLFEDNGNGNYILHVDQAVAQLKEDNLISNITKIEVLGLSHQWKKSFFHINFGVRTNVGVSFKKALAELAAFGNGPYVGQTLEIGPSIDAQAFTEIGVGYSHQIGSLRVGATVKFLNGLASATTTKSKISVYTDPEYYQLTATSDYELQSSSFISLDSLGKINLSPENFTPQMALKNGGTAFDLGLDYKITDRLSVSASAIDLGSILWKENAQTLTSKGSFTYDGLAADGGLSAIDSTSLTDLVDSVQNIFNFSQKTGEFKTPLARKFTVGARYQMAKTTLSGILDVSSAGEKMRPSFALGARTYVAKWIALGGVVSYKNEEIDHLGLNATFKLGPIQLYLLTDNALSYIFPTSANDLHFRAGLNLVFGKINEDKTKEILAPHL